MNFTHSIRKENKLVFLIEDKTCSRKTQNWRLAQQAFSDSITQEICMAF